MDTTFNILLADDDIDEHLFFKEALHKINTSMINVVSVYDGVQLMDYLNQKGIYRNSDGALPDVVILDLNMPLLDGFQVLMELRSSDFQKIPVYILSNSADSDHVNKCREIGCAGYFTKQVKNDKLVKVIENILSREASKI